MQPPATSHIFFPPFRTPMIYSRNACSALRAYGEIERLLGALCVFLGTGLRQCFQPGYIDAFIGICPNQEAFSRHLLTFMYFDMETRSKRTGLQQYERVRT